MLTDTRITNPIKAVLIAAIASMTVISVVVYHASVFGLLAFFCYIVFFVELPGLLIMHAARFRFSHISETLTASFCAGWALIVIEYFISATTHFWLLLYVIGPALSLAYIYLVYRKRIDNPLARFRFSGLHLSFLIAFLLMMLYVFLQTQFVYMDPDYCENIHLSIDKAYQMGLITSLTHGFPLANPWVSGRIVHYHIFTQILLAVPVKLFGLDADFMIMSCNPYITVGLISSSLYAMFRHFCKRKDRAGLYTLSFMLSYMFAARAITNSYLFAILLVNDNYGGSAIACAMICMIVFDEYLAMHGSFREKAPALVVLTAIFMLLSGIKAPAALAVTGGVIGTYILGLILRKISFRELTPPVVAMTIGFVLIYKVFMGTSGTSGVGQDSIFGIANMANICFWKAPLISFMKGVGIPLPARLLVMLVVFTASFLTIYTLAFVIGYIRELVLVISGKKEYNFVRVLIYASALVGYVLMMVLSYTGHSQVYFGTITAAFAPLIVFFFFEDLPDMGKVMKVLCRISEVWFFVIMIFTTITLAVYLRTCLTAAGWAADPTTYYGKFNSLSSYEYEATQWLKENTDEDSLIATQVYMSVDPSEYDYAMRWHNCHFLYADYSDRRFFLEGSGFSLEDYEAERRFDMIKTNDNFFDPDNAERGDEARRLGVDYVMVTKKIFPTPDLTSEDYTLVFTNQDVDIYAVSPAD